MSRTGGTSTSGKYIVIQRKGARITDMWWNEKEQRLYSFDEACASAEKDNAHDDGYRSTVAEVFED